ncbi:hypothetical protein IGI04_039954 [Brassica rapa subsp. trilocularis]|uniref:Uncharacterized protein n=1 Tax=Brassica rapa subsp. trilocularis TaxID=1813537 RepID=A0ABQ7KQQ2_BRACM|nr:hypothetical protein IGI04_039954 [Brassica rapa subsp. trilocularis]
MKRGFLGPSRKEPAGLCTIRQLINDAGSVIPDVIVVAETNTFNLTSQWYDWGSEDPFNGLPPEDPKDLIKRLEELASANKHDEISADHIICKIFPYCLSRDAFSEENGDIGTPTTHVKQPDIQVHHADESKQKDELNREKLVNHDTVKDDDYHVSGEQSKVEEADTKDLTSASIDNSNSESIDIRTSETIDTDICHRSIPSTNPDATTVTSEMIDTDFCYRSIPLEIPERSSCPQDIANSTQESIDESSCDLTSGVDKVTLKDFLELEEWLRQKLDDQPASGKGLENFLKADDIDRHKPDEIDRHSPYDIDLQSPSNIDQHIPDCIARYPPDCIDRHPCLDELSGYIIEPELVEKKEHTSGASHLAVPENLRPPLCEEEAVGICKGVKRIHDPVKFVVPYEMFEAESHIPPDKSMELSSYGGVFDDNKTKSIDTIISSSIDTGQIPSIDTLRESEQKEFEVCQNIFDGGTTMRSDKSGEKKRRIWKKRKRIKGDPQLSLIPHFSDGVRKPRVRSRCFSQPFAKLKALLIAEMVDKGEGTILDLPIADSTKDTKVDQPVNYVHTC